MRRWKWCVSALTLGAIWLIGCGDDEPSGPIGSLLVPASWQGVWEITITSRECDTESLIAVDVVVDTICAGESVDEFLGLRDEDLEVVHCSGTFTDEGFKATCTGSSELFGCSFDLAGTFAADRKDSTFAGGGILNTTSICSGDTIEDCILAEFDARLLAGEPPTCGTPTSGLATRALARRWLRMQRLSSSP